MVRSTLDFTPEWAVSLAMDQPTYRLLGADYAMSEQFSMAVKHRSCRSQ